MFRYIFSLCMAVSCVVASDFEYHTGFGNSFSSEAIEGALPEGQNSPQQCPLGLYAEQLSGTAFTKPRAQNQRSWLYRIRPLVTHTAYERLSGHKIWSDFSTAEITPQQIRWKSVPYPQQSVDFIEGLMTVAGAGSPDVKRGLAIHVYAATRSMHKKAFYDADGDLLIVPQEGRLAIQTEFGWLSVTDGEIAVIPRGIRFSVQVPEGRARGYVAEIFDGHLQLPDLGPIGANGLANARDFSIPKASYEDEAGTYIVWAKFGGELFAMQHDFSPFNVVAYHGNYVPYKYDLSRFNTINSVSYDHPDPSIYTVLTCQSSEPGVAALDFVIFPPRWSVAEDTFRPPWFHRNCMSEYMGLIRGTYEAKEEGFMPGGGSLHSWMTAHGPDRQAVEDWSHKELKVQRVADGTLAFMFETTYLLRPTPYALEADLVDASYTDCWKGLVSYFKRGESHDA